MKIIRPSVEILGKIDGKEMIQNIERYGRVCYKSEELITDGSAEKFIRSRLKQGHESIIEHEKITVKVICDRGVSHEIVRHRLASYSQESTRYCNYDKDKFGNELTFIKPCFWEIGSEPYSLWCYSMRDAEEAYKNMIALGVTPQEARSVLPNSLKTEIIITMNLREWRHFFRMRCDKAAHPQMQEVANMLLEKFRETVPVVFDDLA